MIILNVKILIKNKFLFIANKNLTNKFHSFPLDNQKSLQIKIKTNKIIESIENKMWWYKYSDFDDFESSNIISEIDNHYGFRRKDQI